MNRAHRPDLDRRDRILEATLDIIARGGQAAATCPAVASAAELSMEDVSHDFQTYDEMLLAAFQRLADCMHARFDQAMARGLEGQDARERIVEFVVTEGSGHERDMTLSVELYALAMRDERFRVIIQHWMERSRASLHRHFSKEACPMIDALCEGLILHSYISTEAFDIRRTRRAIYRLVESPLPPFLGSP